MAALPSSGGAPRFTAFRFSKRAFSFAIASPAGLVRRLNHGPLLVDEPLHLLLHVAGPCLGFFFRSSASPPYRSGLAPGTECRAGKPRATSPPARNASRIPPNRNSTFRRSFPYPFEQPIENVRRRALKPSRVRGALTRAGEKACSNTVRSPQSTARRRADSLGECVTLDYPPLDVGKDSPERRRCSCATPRGHLDLPERLVEPLRELIHVPSDRKEHDRQTTTRTTAATARA